MSSMRLRFIVTTRNEFGDSLSQHKYADERRARCKFERAMHTAQCNNGFGIREVVLQECQGSGFINLEKWKLPPDEQIEGYIVHSVRSVNGNATTCKSVNKTFHHSRGAAVRKARHFADKWSDKHEGVLVFKAVAHVQKVPAPSNRQTRIVVSNLDD